MSTLRGKTVIVYWIPYVGIGTSGDGGGCRTSTPVDGNLDVYVPLTDILNYTRSDGSLVVNVVNLSSAGFTGSPDSFTAPYISIPESIIKELTVQPGETRSNVQKLQDAGIKVLLTIQGSTPPGEKSGMGWDHVPSGTNDEFAGWIQTNIISKDTGYGLDGIDIDDEWSGLPSNPQGLVDTVGAMRNSMVSPALISKALWDDYPNFFNIPVSAGSTNAGKYLGQMLDIGSSMNYGAGTAGLESFIESYTNVEIGGSNVGMSKTQLCIGVQAGPPESSWMTSIETTEAVSKWVVQNGYLGIMIFTFTQDIEQWDHYPQNSAGYCFPNPNDHRWQNTVIDAMEAAE